MIVIRYLHQLTNIKDIKMTFSELGLTTRNVINVHNVTTEQPLNCCRLMDMQKVDDIDLFQNHHVEPKYQNPLIKMPSIWVLKTNKPNVSIKSDGYHSTTNYKKTRETPANTHDAEERTLQNAVAAITRKNKTFVHANAVHIILIRKTHFTDKSQFTFQNSNFTILITVTSQPTETLYYPIKIQ